MYIPFRLGYAINQFVFIVAFFTYENWVMLFVVFSYWLIAKYDYTQIEVMQQITLWYISINYRILIYNNYSLSYIVYSLYIYIVYIN